jgi:hypothetical protein
MRSFSVSETMTRPSISPEQASTFAALALGHVAREYPNILVHVLTTDADARTPRDLHPIFYGSFDWHSCVHSYWLLARLHRRFEGHGFTAAIETQLDFAFTEAKVAGELAYLARPSAQGFERPYGWAWLLYLAAELAQHQTTAGRRWAETLAPLAEAFADRFKVFLPKADYPIRGGAHFNTAFALNLSWAYVQRCNDAPLAELIAAKAKAWYAHDEACQAWEPSGDDFLSPALCEAQLMQAILPRDDFRARLARFLPNLAEGAPATLFTPVGVSDRSDGKIAHLDGLNLSRAWAWTSLAAALDDPVRCMALRAADDHLAASLPHLGGDYMGEHWLATYALLALDGCEA